MKKLTLILCFCCSLPLFANGDYQKGQKLAVVCAACHGDNGISLNPEWPNLAGQHYSYLVKQLRDYQQGKRKSAVMAPLVANLSAEDIKNIATFYSQLPLAQGKTQQQYLARGQQLYRGGDFNKHITACIACHGPDGKGNGPAGFPVLSGQHAAYNAQQLQAFKNGDRNNDLYGIMRDISSRMSDEDMQAVASYTEGLH